MADENEINVRIKIEREQPSDEQQERYDNIAYTYSCWFQYANDTLGKLSTGASVLSTLHHQRNQLVQISQNDENIEASSQVLPTMTCREATYKMIGYVVLVAIAIVVIIIITFLDIR